MIGEQCGTARIIAIQILIQCDTHEDRALRVSHDSAREVENVSQPVTTAGGDEQHEIPLRVEGCELCLMGVVASQFAFDRFDIQSRANALGPVVEFHAEVKRSAVGSVQLKCTVGHDDEPARLQCDTVFTSEMSHGNPLPMSGDHRLHKEVSQAACVMMVSGGDGLEESSRRQCRPVPLEPLITRARQLPVVRCPASPHGRERPTLKQSRLAQLLQPTTEQSFLRERLGECGTQPIQLVGGERVPVDGLEDCDVSRRELTSGAMMASDSRWHRTPGSVA